jgi:ubiquinone/menaquinone biosynthesis C-methylase UbiE
MLSRRYDPEMMDDFSIQDERMDRALGELKELNRYLGGKATTQEGFRFLREKLALHGPLSVLDIGAGGADVFEDSDQAMSVTVLDRNLRVCRYLKARGLFSVVCGDVLHPSFRERTFDVVHASLLLHHFREEEIKTILSLCLRISRRGVIINDLRRSIFAYAGITILTKLFSKSPMVKHDGPLSVLRGFSMKELKELLASSGITKYSLRRTWAFRWMVVIEKEDTAKK